MNTVSFQNKGLIDKVAIRTFGISAKDCDDPIGFFGTGLKYAIAILLRNDCSITIYRGHEAIEFTTVRQTVRGKKFDVVCMDGVEMGFTLELGKTWEMWQAFRELYCNTMDEQGDTCGNPVPLMDGCTTILVHGEAFYNEYVGRDRIILASKPAFMNSQIEVHDRPSSDLFFRGVRVGQLEHPSIFTYNFLSGISLTEDRTVKYVTEPNDKIRQIITHGDDEKLIHRFVTAPKDTYEAKQDMDWNQAPSDAFLRVLDEVPFRKILNVTILNLYKRSKQVPKVPTILSQDMLTDIERQQFAKAIKFCHRIDFPVAMFVVNVTQELEDNMLGMAYAEEIYISRRTFMQGTKMVAVTLIEEYLHLSKGFKDCEYPLQNYLFEKIVSIGEQMLGEPL